MRILFMGSPDLAVPVLEALHASYGLVGVVTQPDRPAGRGSRLRPPPVKTAAQALGVEVYQPPSLRDAAAQSRLAAWQPDVIVVAAYGQILPSAVLTLPLHGCLNLHASLLPRWRGASPIAAAILAGDGVTGVTLMQMDEGMDTGPILLQRAVEIAPDETRGELERRLAELGAELVVAAVRGYARGKLRPRPQPEEGSLAPRLKKDDARIDWNWPASKVHNWVRGMHPWPVAFTHFRGRLIRIHRTRLAPVDKEAPPGTLLPERGRLFVACGEGGVEVLQLQPAGKRIMSARDFLNGYRPVSAERFSSP